MPDTKKYKHARTDAKGERKDTSKQRTIPLPQTRPELLALHRETRARRNAATWGSAEHVEAITLLERIEIEIARVERAMEPPLV